MSGSKSFRSEGRSNLSPRGGLIVAGACLSALAASAAQADKTAHPTAFSGDIKTVAQPTMKEIKADDAVKATAAPVTAMPAKGGATAPHAVSGATLSFDHVLADAAADGSIWAAGKNYKARFAADGFTYIPFLGSSAPKNYPLSFSIADIRAGGRAVAKAPNAQVSMQGDRVSIDHGGVIEQYDLALDSVEQSFVFNSLPAHGDLSVKLDIQGEFAPSVAGQGLKFAHQRGTVTYDHALVFDAAGRQLSMPIGWADGKAELRVPASFIASATFPVTVDPLIGSVSFEDSTSNRLADVAYDLSSNRYMVVWEYNFSDTDGDIYSALYTSGGAFVAGSIASIDQSSDNWRNPHVANNRLASQFLAVAEVSQLGGRQIYGRTRDAATGSQPASFQISPNTESGDKHNASVGGDPSPFPETYYCVSWERDLSDADHDIHARMVKADGTFLTDVLLIDNSSATVDTNPSISKSDGEGSDSDTQVWTIVWQRTFSATDQDIRGAQVKWDGTIVTPSFGVDTSGTNDRFPTVSSIQDGSGSPRAYMVAYQEGADAGPRVIYARVYKGSSLQTGGSLTAIENVNTGLDHVNPSVDCDGSKFAVAYSEYFGTGDYDTYVSSWCYSSGSGLRLAESRRNLDYSFVIDHPVRIVANHSGGAVSKNFLTAWVELTGDFGTTGKVYGDIFQTGNTCCLGDVNDNGVVDIDDLFMVINSWGSCFNCDADVNGSLETDVDDLFIVINQWGNCQP